jgi:hypothetical protein
MHPNAILNEVRQLYNVSDRLDSLAGQHPLVSEALISISGSVRNAATLLSVLVAMKIAPHSPDWIRQVPDWLIAVLRLCFRISARRLVVENDI